MTKLYLYGGILLAILAGIATFGWRMHSKGFDAGVKDGNEKAAAADAARVVAQANALEWQVALGRLRDDIAAEKAKADAVQAQAAAAVAKAQAEAADADASMKTWQSRYTVALRKPTCAALLKEALCSDLSGF